jgi:cytochrome P450
MNDLVPPYPARLEGASPLTIVELDAAPYPFYAEMRRRAPVHFAPDLGMWQVFRHRDIQTVMGDPASYSSEVFHAAGRPEMQTLAVMDPPRHTTFRKLLTRAFTAKMVAMQAPNIRATTIDLVNNVVEEGRIDIVKDVAFPLPALIIAGMLGLPRPDIAQFQRWAACAVDTLEATMRRQEPAPQSLEAVKQMTDYLAAVAIERRRSPGEDLLSALATATADGERLSIEEISNACKLLTVAGFDTTRLFIGTAMHILLQHHEARAQLQADPGLFDPALDESLRYCAPFQFLMRIARRDVELGGQRIGAGQWVMIFIGSGNRDEAVFPDPDRFDITRTPNRHLSFGHGIHYCLGAQLGRLEAKIAVNTMLQRLPGLRLDPDAPATRASATIQFGFSSMPALFEPGARLEIGDEPLG